MIKLPLSLLLTFVAGGLYALCYPSFLGDGWFPLLFVALPFFLWRLENSHSWKELLLHVLIYNMGLNLVGYYWIPHTLREFGQLPWVVSVLLGMFFALILQPHWLTYIIWKKFRPEFDWKSENGILITALVMTLLERFFPQQFPSFTGSPWLHLAPFLGMAPILGVVFFSFISYWVAIETFTQLEIKKFRPQVWIALVVFVLLNTVFPLKERLTDQILTMRLVQANIGNFLKVQSENGDGNSYEAIKQKYERLSNSQNGFKPQLIVWPETAHPNSFYGLNTEIDDTFKRIMGTFDNEILIGGYDHDLSKDPAAIYETVFNSSILMSEGKVKSAYHKNILIPFGETLPFGPLNSQIVSIVPAVSLFARGTGTPLMETKLGQRFVTPICYEILESNYMRSLLNEHGKNQLIINHTNDSWYGKTAEPYQHLFLSKWRALEFQLPIARSTNTGISSVIYPDGSESRRLEIGEEAILDVNVPLGTGEATFYQKWGAYPFLLFALVLIALTWLREKYLSEELKN